MGECGHCTLPQMYSLDLNEAVCITSIFRSLQPNGEFLLPFEGAMKNNPPAAFPPENTGKLLENRTNSQHGKTNISLRPLGRWVSSFKWDITVLQPFLWRAYYQFSLAISDTFYLSVVTGKNLRFHSGFVMNILQVPYSPTLVGTNISLPRSTLESMIFPFPKVGNL